MNNPQKELIDHIRETLCDYEEPYMLGAWENFNRKTKKRTFPLLRYSAAAVIAALGLYVFLPKNYSTPPVDKRLKQEIVKQNNRTPAKAERIDQTNRMMSLDHKKNEMNLIQRSAILKKSSPAEELPMTYINPPSVRENQLKAAKSSDTSSIDYKTADNSLNNDNENPIITSPSNLWDSDGSALPVVPHNVKKWGFDLQLSSSMLKGGNVSAGIQVDYKLTEKVILSSGLSVGVLAATEKFSGPSATNKHLQSTDTKLTGVEIPLEIKYSLSSNFYTSVGVTSFAVLNDNRTNNYIEQKTITESVVLASGQFVTRTSIVEQELSEKAHHSSFDDTDHVGFYFLSIGYKSKISKKNTLSIEPFVKIPSRGLTNSNLKLGNGGLKLKIGF